MILGPRHATPAHRADQRRGLWEAVLARDPAARCAVPLYGALLDAAERRPRCLRVRPPGAEPGRADRHQQRPFVLDQRRGRRAAHPPAARAGGRGGGRRRHGARRRSAADHAPLPRPLAGARGHRHRTPAGAAAYRVFARRPRRRLLLCAEDAGGDGLGSAEVAAPAARHGRRDSTPPPSSRRWRRAACAAFIVEGGGVTVSRFLAAGCLDRLHVTIAPLLLGSGVPAFTLARRWRGRQDGLRLRVDAASARRGRAVRHRRWSGSA